jgi:hypothetical protein
MDVFVPLENLKTLSLAHNPLSHLAGGETASKQRALLRVDLSYTELTQFSSKVLANFLTVRSLNLSHTTLHSISDDGLSHVTSLSDLDLTGSSVVSFPVDVFQGVASLQRVLSDNYKLCCPGLLPTYFMEHNCVAPRSELSSCQDLLRAEGYRVFLWLICVCAVTGNVFCLAFRFRLQRKVSKSAFNTFVSSLGVADFLMGVYIAIIGAADVTFRGRYAQHEGAWLQHAACRVAGFLALLSSEVSAFVILLITIDRFLVLRFPFSNTRFGGKSAAAVCLVT